MGRWSSSDGSPPAKPGVYCIVLDGRVCYVGQSDNLRSRLRCYAIGKCRKAGMFRGIRFISLEVRFRIIGDGRLQLERNLIRRLTPAANRQFAPSIKRPSPEKIFRGESPYSHGMHLQYG